MKKFLKFQKKPFEKSNEKVYFTRLHSHLSGQRNLKAALKSLLWYPIKGFPSSISDRGGIFSKIGKYENLSKDLKSSKFFSSQFRGPKVKAYGSLL